MTSNDIAVKAYGRELSTFLGELFKKFSEGGVMPKFRSPTGEVIGDLDSLAQEVISVSSDPEFKDYPLEVAGRGLKGEDISLQHLAINTNIGKFTFHSVAWYPNEETTGGVFIFNVEFANERPAPRILCSIRTALFRKEVAPERRFQRYFGCL